MATPLGPDSLECAQGPDLTRMKLPSCIFNMIGDSDLAIRFEEQKKKQAALKE